MTFVQQGEWLYVYEDGEQVGQIRLIDNNDGVIHATDLEVKKGHPDCFMELVKRTKAHAKGKLLRMMLIDNGNMERLAHIYARLGARPIGIVMEYDATDITG